MFVKYSIYERERKKKLEGDSEYSIDVNRLRKMKNMTVIVL